MRGRHFVKNIPVNGHASTGVIAVNAHRHPGWVANMVKVVPAHDIPAVAGVTADIPRGCVI